ncbi:hypothetical protein DV738_g3468, partial [Chaetothyriales sp. CBS 135597]
MTFNTTILLPASMEGRNAVRDMVWLEFDSIKVENEYSRQQMASRRQSRKGDLRAEAPIPWLRWRSARGEEGQTRKKENFEKVWARATQGAAYITCTFLSALSHHTDDDGGALEESRHVIGCCPNTLSVRNDSSFTGFLGSPVPDADPAGSADITATPTPEQTKHCYAANMYHHLFSALVAALVLAPASSFLIPASILDLPVGALSPPPPSLTVSSELDCLSCPFPGTEATDAWQDNVDSTIHLDFAVSNAGGLTVNGQPLLSPFSDTPPFVLTASQVRTSDGAISRPLELSFVLVRFDPVFDPARSDHVLLPIQFTIVGVDSKPVKVDTIAIDLFRTQESLSIARLSYLPFETTPGAQTCGNASRWSLCRFKAFLGFRLQHMIAAARHHGRKLGLPRLGCHHGYKHGAPDSAVHSFEELDQQSPSQSPHGQRMHHHHHGRMHRFGKLVHHAIRYFFIPATLGIIGGLVASAVGMLLAQFAMYLWQVVFPSPTRPNEVGEVSLLIVEEKIALMAEDDESSQLDEAPPRYKDLEAQTVEAKN